MLTALIAIPCPMDHPFTYLWPFAADVKPGTRVKVPFGNSTRIGLVVSVKEEDLTEEQVADLKLRSALEVLDEDAIWDEDSWKTWTWMANYYCYPIGDALGRLLPPTLRKGEAIPRDNLENLRDFSGAVTYTPGDTSNVVTPSQKKLIELVRSAESGMTRPEMEAAGASGRVIDTLIRTGALLASRQTETALALTEEQQAVFDGIGAQLDRFGAHLIDGVTGSGKTEVYIRLIEKILETDRQVLYLVPEINLTPQTCARLEARFGDDVAVMHSALKESDRLNAWARARNGTSRIVMGTRSALFTPMPRLGMIIIDEEHDSSYKQDSYLHYHARDVAMYLGRQRNVPVVLGSATPCAETLRNVMAGRITRHRMLHRATGTSMPKLRVIDAKSMPHPDGITRMAMTAIKETLERGEQAMVYLPRRGFAHVLFCNECGWASDCPHCSARMTLHRAKGKLICHHCEHTRKAPQVCPNCSAAVVGLGAGTERAEALLVEAFGEDRVVRFDTDSLSTPKLLQAALARVRSNDPLVIIGTQMISKGHDFPNVTLTVVTGTDSALFSAEHRAPERVIQQITQVAGRSGRAKEGRVLVQTSQPFHPVLVQLLAEGYHPTLEGMVQRYEEMCLPPVLHSACITVEDRDGRTLERTLQSVVDEIDHDELLGPFPAPMERKAGFSRFQVIIVTNNRATRHKLALQMRHALKLRAPKLHAVIDIDPQG
ncbi:replication restart helicase PriA [Geopseudomonas aromaticivorans]